MIDQGYVLPDGGPAKRTLGHAMEKRWGGDADTWRQTIIRILNGKSKHPQAETSARFAKVLKQPPDFLLSENVQQTVRGSGLGRTIRRMAEAQEAGEDPSVYAGELAAELEEMRRLLEAAEAALARLAPARKRNSR
jgi:transcriptional regulator with XRE-family HTH domain